MAEKIDIKDFPSISGVIDGDNILLARSSGAAGKMNVSLFRSNISAGIKPSIKEGKWWIGTVNTNVVAEGQTPVFRTGSTGIEWKYENSATWLLLVPYADISMTFDDLSPAQKEELKLHFSDLSAAEIAVLQQPAKDMIASLNTTNTNVQNAEKTRVIEFTRLKTESETATASAIDTATHPTYVGTDYYVYKWNKTSKVYEKTNIFVKGEGFSIAKVFPSIAAMNAAIASYKEGDFVLIDTGSVQDVDTGKLYVRGTTAWQYLTDMSGVQGISGKTPQMYKGTVTTGAAGTNAVVTVVKRAQDDASGNPQYDINFTIPRGDKGDAFRYSDFTQTQLNGLKGPTGYTPIFSAGTVSSGANPSATLIADGVDVGGNPKYKINMVLPKGDQGFTPVFQIGSVTTGGAGTTASAGLTKTGTSADGSPIYSLILTIPRGDKGIPGEGSGNVKVVGTGLVAGKQYLFKPGANNSPEGTFVEYVPVDVSKLDYMDVVESPDIKENIYDRVSDLEINVGELNIINIDLLAYGIQWDSTIANSACTRIGNLGYHKTLPVQSKMKRCLLKDDGTVNYYLHPDDSLKKQDGTSSVLNGADGMVMVEIPKHYRRFETEGTVYRCLISEYNIPGFHLVPLSYRSAYEAALDRTVASAPKLASVVNTTGIFRGGNNTSAWDGTYRSFLGRPITYTNLTNFRKYARNRGSAGLNGAGWNCDVYEVQKTCYWLYTVEYANFNCELAYNAALTIEGYKQGGLSEGVVAINSSIWNSFNGYGPFIPCGYTNRLGNRTGIVAFAMPSEGGGITVQVPSYRGLENPLGHIWSWTDGCKCRIQSNAAGGLSEFYVCLDPSKFQDTDYTDYIKIGEIPRVNGYIKSFIGGRYGENMASNIGGSSTTYFADYLIVSIPDSGEELHGVQFGGASNSGVYAGFGCVSIDLRPSGVSSATSSRLCFLP